MELSAKVAELQRKAAVENVPLPYVVAFYIATAAPTATQRELEGLMSRLFAYASLTEQDITLPLAREVLAEILGDVRH